MNVTPPPSQTQTVNNNKLNDKIVLQLLRKLEEGTETITNLRSLLTLKTVELNEIISQLELIDQVLNNVENGTEQIELVLENVLKEATGQDKLLLDAEATLDSAIKSAACACYLMSDNNNNKKKKARLLNKINQLLLQLDIDSEKYFDKEEGKTENDLKVLQKAFIHLDLAKNIASTIKSDVKHRSTLIKNNKYSSIDEIKKMGLQIKNQVKLYKLYTRNTATPLLFNGKQDIITLIDREDQYMLKRVKHVTRQQQQHPLVTIVHNKQPQPHSRHTTTTTTTNTVHSRLSSISRHTSSSKAKSKEPKRQQEQQQGPGYTLRLRNLLAKRNLPSLSSVSSCTTVY